MSEGCASPLAPATHTKCFCKAMAACCGLRAGEALSKSASFFIAFTVNESSAQNELYKSIDSLILLIGLAFLSGRIPSP